MLMLSWLAWVTAASILGATVDETAQTWPQVWPGLWLIEGTLSIPGKKERIWREDSSQCTNPAFMFQGYWGDGIIEREGCRFQSSRTMDGTYLILAECSVRRRGHSQSRSTVTLEGETSFTMDTVLREGRQVRKISQTGTWKAACPEAKLP